MVNDVITSTDLKYAQHNPFFASLQKDIDEIKTVNKLLRKDSRYILEFHSLITAMYNAHIVYSPKELDQKLSKIQGKIYGVEYQKALKEKNIGLNLKTFETYLILDLESCWRLLIINFEANGLIPKRIISKTNKIGAVRMIN